MKVKELMVLLSNIDQDANINFLDNCLGYHSKDGSVQYIDENSYIKYIHSYISINVGPTANNTSSLRPISTPKCVCIDLDYFRHINSLNKRVFSEEGIECVKRQLQKEYSVKGIDVIFKHERVQ